MHEHSSPPASRSLWRDSQPLVLASRSQARRELCAAAGIPIECIPADIDERSVQRDLERDGASPASIAQALARAKAQTISAAAPGRLVLGGDQTLSLGPEILTKPGHRSAAARQLEKLSGRTHELHAGLSVVADGQTLFEIVQTARLTVRPLSADFIAHYLGAAGDDVLACVGAYQLERLGIHLFASIDGDQTTVMGMPMLPLIEFLRVHGSLAA